MTRVKRGYIARKRRTKIRLFVKRRANQACPRISK